MQPRDHDPGGGAGGGGLGERLGERLGGEDATSRRPPLVDLLLAAALGLPAAVIFAAEPTTPTTPAFAPVWLGWLLVVAVLVPLGWRRVAPVPVMTVTGTATGVFFTLGYSAGLVPLGVLVALYSITAYTNRAEGVVSLAVSLVFITAGFVSAGLQGAPFTVATIASNLFVFVGTWALGDRTRVRREKLAALVARAEEAERSRALTAGLAVAEERARIARELHDVVAHTVSVVVVQAGAGRRVAERDPARAVEVLAGIERTGRDALAELRRMVGVLREPSDRPGSLAPQPTLDELPDLVARLADTGVPVTIVRSGQPRPLPPGVEVSGYRIAQEALTNVLRHAGAVTRVEVEVDYQPEAVTIRVRDDGRGDQRRDAVTDTPPDVRQGAGLVGMRERTSLFGGRLAAGTHPDGGFEVRASLPLRVPGPDPIADPHEEGAP